AQNADAAGSLTPVVTSVTGTAPGPGAAATSTGFGAGALAQRFAAHAESASIDVDTVRDVFVASPSWSGSSQAGVIDPDMAPTPEEMIRRYEVTGVIQQGANSGAIINGEFVRRGGLLDGYRLVTVNARSVVLEAGQITVTLEIDP
ncbi:MAG: hypothetical protein KC983_08340, partial [Phycisphaerales bacterium]|nr:hypothetical protein [Phycisphaerales bacterium]